MLWERRHLACIAAENIMAAIDRSLVAHLPLFAGLSAEDLTEVLNRLEPLAAELGCARELAYVETMMTGEAGYLRQRRIAQENGGDLRAVVRDIVAQNREIR